MGCGTSISDDQVKEPSQAFSSLHQIKQLNQSNQKLLNDNKLQQINHNNAKIEQVQQKEQKDNEVLFGTKIYLFGESATERKIIQFSANPTPTIQILLSRNNNPTPIKYQPNEVILEESQELCSSFMYNSASHPPYNYMFATYTKNSVIFLCGGVDYDFTNVSNEAFLYSIKEEPSTINLHKGMKENKRRIGNNLMGTKFDKLALMKHKRYSHMGVHYKVGLLGYIYVMGGRSQNDKVLSSCERFSISQNKWQQIASMNYPRSTGFSLIINQKIYVFGGFTNDSKRSKKIQRYNNLYNSWEILNIQLHKGIQTGLLLQCPQKNDLLIVGGNVEFGSLRTVLRINFQNETYNWDSDMKRQRLLQKGLSIVDQNVAYVFGGDFDDTIEKYSYKDKVWKNVTNLSYSSCISPEQINAFTMAQPTIQLSFDSSQPQQKQKQIQFFEQTKFIFGSDDYPCIFQLNTQKWVLKKKTVPMVLRLRSYMTTSKIKQGKIFIGGGIDSYFEKASRSAYIYYPGTNKAIQIAKMREKKFDFTACTCGNFVYTFGGRKVKEGDSFSCAQKYNINEDKWIALPDMPRERAQAKSICTPNQKNILLFGGNSYLQSVSQIDILNTQTDTFSKFRHIIPLPLDIKTVFLIPTAKQLEPLKKLKTQEEFQFLDEINDTQEKEKQQSQEKNKENTQSQQNIKQKQQKKQQKEQSKQQKQDENQENYDILIFNYNSYTKQHNTASLTMQLQPQQQILDNNISKNLQPFSLAFEIPSQKGQNCYFMISNKGVFKWKQGNEEVSNQIVINQIHILQMPIDRFTII